MQKIKIKGALLNNNETYCYFIINVQKNLIIHFIYEGQSNFYDVTGILYRLLG